MEAWHIGADKDGMQLRDIYGTHEAGRCLNTHNQAIFTLGGHGDLGRVDERLTLIDGIGYRSILIDGAHVHT